MVTTGPLGHGPVEEGYEGLVTSVRRLLDVLVESVPAPADSATYATEVDDLAARITSARVTGAAPLAGQVDHLPGRAHPMLPQVEFDLQEGMLLRGRVVFTDFFHGAGGAVHGGVVALLFDEVIGRHVNTLTPDHCRTAFLHVDYRQLTQVGVEHVVESRIDELDGRKQYASGSLWRDGELVAEAHGLFVHPR